MGASGKQGVPDDVTGATTTDRARAIASWRARRSFLAEDFPLGRLLAAKRASVSVVLPAREEAATVGTIVATVAELRDRGLIDEVVVVDAASGDGTARVAAAAGARVVQEDSIHPELGPTRGKGDAMWRGLTVTTGEVVVYLDADTADFDPRFVLGLLGPVLCDPDIDFVKGTFARPLRRGPEILAGEGGRVTELVARPLLNLYAPALGVFDQPLAGELAVRRGLLERLPFSVGYGVEIAMLIDAWREVGLDRLAQVDLGTRQNRHQSLRALSAMAYAVIVAAGRRFHPEAMDDGSPEPGVLALPPLDPAGSMELRPVATEERPPLRSLALVGEAGRRPDGVSGGVRR
ncbi:MAG: glucosyl-3-phosphoglycerate synthase [Solirubrobacteraceae bacterium]|nr:glucosyl-3-phosphoglycerate synthase [Solirubrobacteraceae bacterium]